MSRAIHRTDSQAGAGRPRAAACRISGTRV